MSKQDDPIVQPYLKADISYEDDPFNADNVRYGGSDGDYLLEGRINSERKILQIFCPSKFNITKTYQLVLHSPKEGEAQLVYIRPSSEGYYNFRSNRGELKFVAEPSGLHGFFEAVIDAIPGEFPETTITGSFRVHSI